MYVNSWRRLFSNVTRIRYAGRRHVEVVPETIQTVRRLVDVDGGVDNHSDLVSRTVDICKQLTDQVVDLPIKDSISALAALSQVSQKFDLPPSEDKTAFILAFLDVYDESLRRKEPSLPAFEEVVRLMQYLAALKFDVLERLKGIYRYAEQCVEDVPPQGAIDLLHLALREELIPVSALSICEPILERAMQVPSLDDLDLEAIKEIEIILRLDFAHLYSTFKKRTMEYLLAVREAKLAFEAPEDTVVSYQLRYFLQNHEYPATSHAVGPYVLPIADPVRRICFLIDREKRRDRHLDLLGWRTFFVEGDLWSSLPHREAKARYVRNLLKENNLLEL